MQSSAIKLQKKGSTLSTFLRLCPCLKTNYSVAVAVVSENRLALFKPALDFNINKNSAAFTAWQAAETAQAAKPSIIYNEGRAQTIYYLWQKCQPKTKGQLKLTSKLIFQKCRIFQLNFFTNLQLKLRFG